MKQSHRVRNWSALFLVWGLAAFPALLPAQQTGVVTGRVLDNTGNGVVGVSVSVVDTNISVVTGNLIIASEEW